MSVKTSTELLMLKLSSDPRNISEVESFVQHLVKRYRLSADQKGNILISLTEAVNNAIIHGNERDHSKQVSIHMREDQGNLAIQVSDEGRGFDFRALPDPTAPENRCKCGGRGVFLMQCLSDGISFRNGGRTVEMQFKL